MRTHAPPPKDFLKRLFSYRTRTYNNKNEKCIDYFWIVWVVFLLFFLRSVSCRTTPRQHPVESGNSRDQGLILNLSVGRIAHNSDIKTVILTHIPRFFSLNLVKYNPVRGSQLRRHGSRCLCSVGAGSRRTRLLTASSASSSLLRLG